MPTIKKRNEIKLPATFIPYFWSDADQRSVVVRKIKQRYKKLKEDSGADSYQKDLLVRRAIFITLQLETMEVEAIRERGTFELGVYTQMTNALLGLLKSLGLEKKHVSELVNLKEYVEAKGGKDRER